MKRILFSLAALISFFPITLSTALSSSFPPTPPPKGSPTSDPAAQVEQAVREALTGHLDDLLVTALYRTEVENIKISSDGAWATAWLVPHDPETGAAIPAEPGLAVVENNGGEWQTRLPSDPAWVPAVEEAPTSLLASDDKRHWLELYASQTTNITAGPFGGYLLPWAAGTHIVLTRSITHYNPPDPTKDMHYAFDFAAWHDSSGSSPMFPLYASKAGTVKYARWIQENGSESSPGNYLVLEDTTTTPTTYQLYLHLAKDSIPPALRVAGIPVLQGQYLGLADDTGASTGNHLHFQVQVATYPNSYWGKSVDITFADVAINGGRPRMLSEAKNYPQYGSQGQTEYVSGNVVRSAPTPPAGDILEPSNGILVSTGNLHLKGWASDDDAGLYSAQFIAHYDGSWHTVGTALASSSFEMDWDLCADSVPDGPVDIALRLRDNAGSQSVDLPGLRHFIKNFTCPPPPPGCTLSADNVVLFSEADFQGTCTALPVGTYNNGAALGSVGSDNAASIRVGANVQATLYLLDNKVGRPETFLTNDSNLEDNKIGANTTSSAWIQARPVLQTGEKLPTLSPSASLTGPAMAATAGVSFFDDMENGENGWKKSSTSTAVTWQQVTDANHTPGKKTSWRYASPTSDQYNSGGKNSGSLTSPVISIPASGSSTLRFWYLYQTESAGVHWDQRWLQVSVDGGKTFLNSLQLSDDSPGVWRQSPAIDLTPYAGLPVQIRFLFDTVDEYFNGFKGWYIDDVSIGDSPPLSCESPGEPNNTPSKAQQLAYNTSTTGLICPEGDVDFYQFTGQAGDHIGARVEAQGSGSKLDPFLYLLDSDGSSALAYGDDLVPYERTDSALSYILPRSGVYYLKVRAWDHPSAGGSDYPYTLKLFEEKVDPAAQLTFPVSGTMLPGQPISVTLTVSTSDAASGVSHVEFLWHSGDWENGDWEKIGQDWDGKDGWSSPFNLSKMTPQSGAAFYARVYDWAGNWIGAGSWDITRTDGFVFFPFMNR